MYPRRYLFVAAAAAACFVTSLAPRLAADPFDDIAAQEIGSALGRNLAGAIDAAARTRQAAARFSSDIAAARRAYWEAVRTGRGVEAAKARFREEIDVKDLVFLILAIPEGVDGPRAVVANLISGDIDGGIHASARDEFLAWIKAIRVNLGAEVMWWHRNNTFVIPTPGQLAEALKASDKQYQRYLRARDWAEIDRSGLTWPWDTDARAHAIMLLNRYGNWTGEDLKQRYRDLVAMFGESELLSAADRIRQARRNGEAMLATPAALGVTSPDPNYALLELLALKNGRTYLSYLLCNTGTWVVPSRAIPEARRELESFIMAYGDEAIDEVGRVIQKLPRFSTGQIRLTGAGDLRKLYPHVALNANAVVAFWDTLALRYPEGRQRAVFTFHPDVNSAADADRLRAGLEKRYGRDAVLDALRALLGQEPYAAVENWKRRGAFLQEFHKSALEKRGLDAQRQRYHLYDTDYEALVRLLEQGVANVIGEPGGAWNDEEYRKEVDGRNYTEDWQRRGAALKRQLHGPQEEIAHDSATYPYARQWLSYASVGMHVSHFLNPEATAKDAAVWHPHRMAQAIRTLQIHSDITNNPQSAVSRLTRIAGEAIGEVWPRVRSLDQRYQTEEFELPGRPGVPDRERSELNAILGAWSGQLPRARTLTLTLAWPNRAGGPVATADYSPGTPMYWYFLTRGYPTAIIDFPDGWRGYSFIQASAAAENRDKYLGDPPIITVFLTDKGQLEVKYYQYRSGRYREMSRALLDRRDGGGTGVSPVDGTPRRQHGQDARATSNLPTRSPETRKRGPSVPGPAASKAESAVNYDGNTLPFNGGAAEIARLKVAAGAGDTRACLLLADLMVQRKTEGTMAEAIALLENGYRRRDAECTARLAQLLIEGHGTEANPRLRNPVIWRHLAGVAAGGNSALGMYLMARCMGEGIGGPPSEPAARMWYEKAATAGHSVARQWCRENGVAY